MNVSALSCAEVRELAPELALGHPERCRARRGAPARQRVRALPGLRRRAHRGRRRDPAAGPRGRAARRVRGAGAAPPRVHRERRIAPALGRRGMAVAAAAAIIVSITVVRVIENGDSSSRRLRGPRRPRWPGQAGGGADGADRGPVAGRVGLRERPARRRRRVSYGMTSGGYTVRVKSPDGRAENLGTMTVNDNHGSWTGRSDRPITAGSTISLVDPTGAAVCHGTVPTAL